MQQMPGDNNGGNGTTSSDLSNAGGGGVPEVEGDLAVVVSGPDMKADSASGGIAKQLPSQPQLL